MSIKRVEVKTIMIYNCPLPEMNKKISEVMKVLRQWGAYQITMTIEHRKGGGFNILIFLTDHPLKAIEISQLYKAIAKTGKPLTEIYINKFPDESSDESAGNSKKKSS